MRLKDKVAIVTGGVSGIGEATVRELIKEGAKVAIADLNYEKGIDLEKELNKDGEVAFYLHTDMTKETDVRDLVEETVKKFGNVDIMFNNAGIGQAIPVTDLSFEDWGKVISVNLSGVFLGSKFVIDEMKKNGKGSIINCASILGTFGQANTASYSAAKGGVINLTRTLAIEYAKEGIRVNAVSPGYIETPLLDGLDKEMKDYLTALHPIGRLGKPEEIAKAVVFLASDDASFITGANLLVDGGYTAGK